MDKSYITNRNEDERKPVNPGVVFWMILPIVMIIYFSFLHGCTK